MKKLSTIIIALTCLISTAHIAVAKSTLSLGTESPLDISADRVEYLLDKKVYIIKGNATVKSEGKTLTADEITIDGNSNKASAKGNAVITTADDTVSADEIEMDLTTNFGVIVNGKIFVKSENFHITGKSLERTGENSYVVKDGTFTTCDGDVPSWKFSASRLDIEIDGYVFAYNPIFYIKNVPSFYMPMVIFPIKKTRQSGFLFPTIGYTTDDGMIFKLPYYQVISDSADATLTLDTRSKMGIGMESEFRYMLSDRSRGEINYNIMDEYSQSTDRWLFNFRHQEYFDDSLYFKADMKTVSDNDYFFDFGDGADERNAEKIESHLTLTKSFSNALIQVEHSYDKDLVYDDALGDLSTSNMQLPKITGELYKTQIFGTPLYFSAAATYNKYMRKEFDDFDYLKLNPKLSADLNLGRYAVLSPYIKLEHASFRVHGPTTSYDDNYYSYLFGTNLSSNIARVFTLNDTLKLRHSLNPVIEYEYIPKQNTYPEFYELAGIEKEREQVTFRLINRLTLRRENEDGEFEYRDPVRLEIAQTYDFYERERDFDLMLAYDEKKPFKPLMVDLDVKAGDYLTLDATLYHDHYKKDHIQQSYVAITLKDKRKDSFEASHTYLKNLDDYLKTYLNVNVGYGVSLNNTYRYDFIDNKTMEKAVGIGFDMQCWAMNLTYSEELVEDNTVTPADSYIDKKVFFYVSLLGVGDTKNMAIK